MRPLRDNEPFEHVLDGIGIHEMSRRIVRRDGLDLRDTGVIAVAVSVRDGLLLGDLVRLEIGNLGWKLVLPDRVGGVAQAFGAYQPRSRSLRRFELLLGKLLQIDYHGRLHVSLFPSYRDFRLEQIAYTACPMRSRK